MRLQAVRRGVVTRVTRHRWPAVAVAMMVALAGLSACKASSPAAGAGGESGTLKIAYPFSEVQGVLLDAVASKGGYHPYMTLMYDTMIHMSAAGKLEPGLAVGWSLPDNHTVDLKLRQGVKFQDGTPFNADAVKFSWDRIIASKTMQKSSQIAALASVDAPSEYEVVVHLNGPYAMDWRDRFLISAFQLAVVSPTAVKKLGADFSTNPVAAGAGPYEFVSYAPNQSVVLKANPKYWDPKAVTLGGVKFINTQPGAPTIAALKSGVADMAFATGGADIGAAKSQGLNVTSALKPDWNTGFYFCTSKAPFNNLDARKAVMYALDRESFVDGPMGGYAKANSTTIPVISPDYPGDAIPNPYDHDVDKAKGALAAAGVAPGTTVTILANPTQLNSAIMQMLQAQLKVVGLDLKILPTANAVADLATKKPDIWYQGDGLSYGSQSIFLAKGGSVNYCGFDDQATQAALLKTQDPTLSGDARKQAWAEFQRAYYQSLPGFNIADIEHATITTSRVHGVPKMVQFQGEPESFAGITVN